ncbi:MAG TPA: hypothetical protein VJS64_18730, partial [Pyrinomonadaceae bacterium]|nr:hypothetical protein [Pyrinomonadaceae bacterium]
MSEVRLNLIDSQTILSGTIHGSVVDSCIAALSAEPETISELAAALGRYEKQTDDSNPFGWFHPRSSIDERPYDAGIVIIDLAARIVAAESTYSHPQPEGEVNYHDGHQATDVSIPYRIPADWLLVNSIDAHRWSRERHVQERQPFFDARTVLYGRPLLEFIVGAITPKIRGLRSQVSTPEVETDEDSTNPEADCLNNQLMRVHVTWLTTPRSELNNHSPRDIMLERQDFIDFDLHTRSLQWTFLNEGPPCLLQDSFAYRFAGFGTHEWVVYYDLVRDLLKAAVALDCSDLETSVRELELIKTEWLESGNDEYGGRTPAVIIDNERRRLPEAMAPEQLIIDEDCECCRMMAQDAAMGFGPGFWHLDGSHMEEEFAFSFCKTIQEWETELQRREESYREFERQWAEREHERRMRQRECDDEQL